MVYKDQVTLTMEQVDDEWLVDDLRTSPVAPLARPGTGARRAEA